MGKPIDWSKGDSGPFREQMRRASEECTEADGCVGEFPDIFAVRTGSPEHRKVAAAFLAGVDWATARLCSASIEFEEQV